jgi:hypothetical protein
VTPTQTAQTISVIQWKQFFIKILSGPTTLIGNTKLQKGDAKRKATMQFMTNLCHSDPLQLFSDSTKQGITALPDNNIGKTWLAAVSVMGCHYLQPSDKQPGKPAKPPEKKQLSFNLPEPKQVTPPAKTPTPTVAPVPSGAKETAETS